MKKLLLLIIFAALVGCTKEPAPLPEKNTLNVTVTQSPQSGTNVSSLSVSFTGTVQGTIKPVRVMVEWWFENGLHLNQTVKNSTEYTFDGALQTTKTTVYTAPAGYVFLNYYWVKISWTDDLGQHLVESSKAYCQ